MNPFKLKVIVNLCFSKAVTIIPFSNSSTNGNVMQVYRILGMLLIFFLSQMCVFSSKETVVEDRLLHFAKQVRHRVIHGLALLYSQEISSHPTAL